jgi:hypothetical protein
VTETELQEIELRLPRRENRVGANLDASQLAAEVRGSWGEGAELRQGLNDARNSRARVAMERDDARALAERYKAERDALIESCGLLRTALAALLNRLPSAASTDLAHLDVVTTARRLLAGVGGHSPEPPGGVGALQPSNG